MPTSPNPSGTPWHVREHEANSEFEVVLLGADNVGKSWLFHRYLYGKIEKYILPTIVVDGGAKIEHLDHGRDVRLIVWDTAGSERFFAEVYCAGGAHAAIVVYDITSESSFKKAKFWVKKLEEVASPDIFKALAGNKADAVSKRMVTYEDAKSYADENGVDLFMEVSAFTGENVENLFVKVGYNLDTANISTAELRETICQDSKALDLALRRLARVSDTVTELTEVEMLDLSRNELTKLPTSTSKLTNLTILNLNHNKLTYFPEIVVELINLSQLFVNNNQLTSLPTSMKNMEKLQKLDLSNNRLKRLFKVISYLKCLEKLYVEGNPLSLQEINVLKLMGRNPERMTIDIAAVAPAEILAQGHVAKLLYEEALRDGYVYIYRGRVLFIGQDRAGKTSLKKSLLGLPFDPEEQSTEGIEVDPSTCEIDVEHAKNWNSTGENRPSLSEFSEDISRIFAEKQYHWILNMEMESERELSGEESKVKSTMHLDAEDKSSSQMNQVFGDEDSLKKTDFSSPWSEMQVHAEAANAVTEDNSVSSSSCNLKKTDLFSPSDEMEVHPDADSAITKDGSVSSSRENPKKTDPSSPSVEMQVHPDEDSAIVGDGNFSSARDNLKNTDVSFPSGEMQVHAEANNKLKEDGSLSSARDNLKTDLSSPSSEMRVHAEANNTVKEDGSISSTRDNLKKADLSSPSSKMQVHADEADRAITDEGSVSSSRESEFVFDATAPPDDVTEHANERLKNMLLKGLDAENAENKKESIVTLDLWDFAGQHLYYASHPVFLSSRAVYVLVHNLSKSLNVPAQPCVRQGTHNVILENPTNETNLENLLSWLVTLHSIKPVVDNSDRMLPYLRPPVFIVGTHADKPFEDTGTMISKIQQGIAGKEYEKHVIRPFFSIDNTRQGNLTMWNWVKKLIGQVEDTDIACGDGIHALQTKIMEVLRQEPYMGEKIPVKWFNFEIVVKDLVAQDIYHMNLKQLQARCKEKCLIENEDQFYTMLNFYHNLGMIVKHRNTVILKAQWLIDLFKMLITIPPFDKADPVHSKYWQEMERTGVLSMELVDHVFSKFIQQGIIKQDILDMMERFGLIAKFSPSPSDVKYFVPAQLKSSPEDLDKMEPSPTDPCPLYLHFTDGFVPHGLFWQLVSKSISWCSEIGSTQPPNLYRNGAWFVVGRQIIHDMILICKKRFIKIFLKQRSQDEVVSVKTSPKVASSVRLFVEGTLQDLSLELAYLRGLRYQFCVACPYCLRESHECVNHSQLSCNHEDCLHLLEIKQEEQLICMESVCDKVLTVRGLEKWFSSGTRQDLSFPTEVGACDAVLRVTLLASEWMSSMGGLSTINRKLATLLAERTQVEVTLLVPQFACSEEEKRAARSHNVAISEAERRPGYNDPLDWLSFPPRDLAIDIVLGHGGKLGKQAQFIRESHNCKWVQVVHTAPEELGMYKNYPQAISKNEEKNRTEVDLCKLANLVVAVGPKLTEAYCSYLRSCKEHQDIIQLTPGTFNEFSVIKQAAHESNKFKVLTFGRGDPEDFSLKGYDIAANAVAELKDNSCRLIFVGAPDGKQEDVAENLLKSGISKDQLTVRKFVQSKERLKELFCEVDLAIMPSRTEGFGLTALEALSAGLPILVGGNSGFADALRALPSGNSFVVESVDPKVWAQAITDVRLKDRENRLQEVQRLRECYEEHYSWEKQCDTLVKKMWSLVHGEQD